MFPLLLPLQLAQNTLEIQRNISKAKYFDKIYKVNHKLHSVTLFIKNNFLYARL